MKPRTLKTAFMLWTGGLFLVILTAFGVYIYIGMEDGLTDTVDESLTLIVAQVISGLEVSNGDVRLSDPFVQDPANTRLMDDFTIRLLTAGGETLQTFGPEDSRESSYVSLPPKPGFSTFDDAGRDTSRAYTVRVEPSIGVVAIVQVAQSLDEVQETLQNLLATLLLGVPVLAMCAGLSGYFLAGRVLGPIDRVTRTAASIAEGRHDLSARLNFPSTDDEVGRLASTFDQMLTRLETAFRREHQFTADASHELRTPLAAVLAILDQIRAKRRSPEEYERALADLAEEAGRLRILCESLLSMARVGGRDAEAGEVIEIPALIGDVADSLRPLAEEKGLALMCNALGDLRVTGNRDEIVRLFVNIVENAIKFTARGSVSVTASLNTDKNVDISVADTGIGIAANQLPHIFDRFYRADQSRSTAGTGLGLSMAQEIARAHGGEINVSSSKGEGTRFTVTLPRAEHGS